jgi:hypothetical protein
MKLIEFVDRVRSVVRQPWTVLWVLSAAGALHTPTAYAAPVVTFFAVDVPDVVAGRDVWRYDYKATGTLGAFETINLIFGAASYSRLTVVSADSRLTMSVTESLPALPADGLVSATASVALGAADEALFSVEFSWAGVGEPTSQAYEWQDDSFNVLGTFQTQRAGVIGQVPEPNALMLVATALAALATMRMRAGRLLLAS